MNLIRDRGAYVCRGRSARTEGVHRRVVHVEREDDVPVKRRAEERGLQRCDCVGDPVPAVRTRCDCPGLVRGVFVDALYGG